MRSDTDVNQNLFPCRWKVVLDKDVNIQREKSIMAAKLGSLRPNDVVEGVEEDGWVRLTGTDGFVVIRGLSTGLLNMLKLDSQSDGQDAVFTVGFSAAISACEAHDAHEETLATVDHSKLAPAYLERLRASVLRDMPPSMAASYMDRTVLQRVVGLHAMEIAVASVGGPEAAQHVAALRAAEMVGVTASELLAQERLAETAIR